MSGWIEELEIENYGCVRKATFHLSPLHAFIGPNDSGKSTILQAIHKTVLTSATSVRPHRHAFFGDSRFVVGGPTSTRVRLRLHAAVADYEVVAEQQSEQVTIRGTTAPGNGAKMPFGNGAVLLRQLRHEIPRSDAAWDAEFVREVLVLAEWATHSQMVRLDPDALRKPSALISRNKALAFEDERGTGLPGVLEAIRDRDEAQWVALRERFLRMFPLVKQLHLPALNENQKIVEIELKSGQRATADLMSEGMLYFLAFLATQYADRPSVLLVEEPENGLHPSRIVEVMKVLREVSQSTQVIIATHSPLVINELRGDEVNVVWRDEEHGTQAMLLKDVEGFEKRSKVFSLGELWVNYADGIEEAPLRQGKPRP